MAKTPKSEKAPKADGRPGLRDVAKAAGVSIATVSYALNGRGNLSKDVIERVRKIAQTLGYLPNGAAQAMRTGKTNAIGLVLPDLTNPFFPELAQSIEVQARRLGLSVFLIDSQGDPDIEREGVSRLVTHGVDGIVWCPCSAEDSLAELRDQIPVVAIDRPIPGYDVVMSDYDAGGVAIAELLTSRDYRRIGILSGPQILTVAQLRRDAFLDHKPIQCEIVWEAETDFSLSLSEAAKRRCHSLENVDVVICANDMIAIAAMAQLRANGVTVPDDVRIIGFDDIPWAQIVSPSLTTIRQPLSELGAKATELLVARIADKTAPCRRVIIGIDVARRDSF